MKRKAGVFVGIWAVVALATGCSGLKSYTPSPDVESGDAAGANGTIQGDSSDIQQAALALGALLSEVMVNRDVRIMLGHSGEGFSDSTCVTSSALPIAVFLSFDACSEGAGQTMAFANQFAGGTLFQFDEGMIFKGVAMTGTLSVTPVDGQPLTWALTAGDGFGGVAPLQMTMPSGTVLSLTPEIVGSLRAAGPSIYVWGTQATPDATLHLGEEGAVSVLENPPGWDAPLAGCACPTIGETNMAATISVDSLVVDLDLLTDGDGIGEDDYVPFTMPIAAQEAVGSIRTEFLETCGDMATEFTTSDSFDVVVAKADIMAAIDADPLLTPDQRSDVRDGAKASLRDEVTLRVKKDVLGAAAQGAVGLDSSFCNSF